MGEIFRGRVFLRFMASSVHPFLSYSTTDFFIPTFPRPSLSLSQPPTLTLAKNIEINLVHDRSVHSFPDWPLFATFKPAGSLE
jgi:hypothetical protein